MKDHFVVKRVVNLIIIDITTLLASLALCLAKNAYLDEMIEFVFLDIIFLVLLQYLLEQERMRRRIADDRETDFFTIMLGYFFISIYAVAISFAPEFLKPFILIPFVMEALSNSAIALCTSLFLTFMVCLSTAGSSQEIIMYGIMILGAVILAEAMEQKKHRILCQIALFGICVMLPGLFYYFLYCEVNQMMLAAGAGIGILMIVFLRLFYDKILSLKQHAVDNRLSDIVEEEYAIAQELKKFSKAEYQHARHVSKVAAQCAALVGADEKVCAAAGLYYRIGIMEGAPFAQSGVHIAQNACFPEAVIKIIHEYDGQEALPSTVESAIVHMVDGLLKKMEVLPEQSTKSQWNQDMIIYQTLNDFSTKGLYDMSGLSMNMFLKIREYLVNEETLL
jgi:hypothetical protein